jgi:hypothetical protein
MRNKPTCCMRWYIDSILRFHQPTDLVRSSPRHLPLLPLGYGGFKSDVSSFATKKKNTHANHANWSREKWDIGFFPQFLNGNYFIYTAWYCRSSSQISHRSERTFESKLKTRESHFSNSKIYKCCNKGYSNKIISSLSFIFMFGIVLFFIIIILKNYF